MRVLGSERALLRSEAGSTLNGDEEILRDRFTRQFSGRIKGLLLHSCWRPTLDCCPKTRETLAGLLYWKGTNVAVSAPR